MEFPVTKEELVSAKAEILKLARSGDVQFVSGLNSNEIRYILQNYFDVVISVALIYAEKGRRMSLTVKDIVYGLKRLSHEIYDYDV